MKIFKFLFLVFFLASPAWGATTRYVDDNLGADCTTGNYSIASRNCSGANGNAWNTVAEGLSNTSAGDTLFIRAGTYTANITSLPSGTSGARITVSRYASETVTIRALTITSASAYVDFFNLIFDGASAIDQPIYLAGGANHLRFYNCEVKNGTFGGVVTSPQSGDTFHELINCNVHHNGDSASSDHGVYFQTGANLIDGGEYHHNAAFGVQFQGSTTGGNILRNAKVYSNSAVGNGGGVVVNSDNNASVYNNLIYNNGPGTPYTYSGIEIASSSGVKVYNNTITGNTGIDAYGIQYFNTTGVTIKNNISYNNAGAGIQNDGGNSGSAVSNNLTTNPSFVDSANSNFALTASSSTAINQGTASIATGITRAFNGTAPDIGAHETIVFSSCSVESGDASTLRLNFTNNVYPPIAGVSTTGFTYRINSGSTNAPNAAVLNGTNRVDLTLQAPVTAGQTIDFSYTVAGSIRDSANIGGTNNQRLNAITNQSCTNNVSGAGPSNLTVSHFRFNNLRSSSTSTPESTRYALAPTDINTTVMPGGLFAVRSKIKCTGGDCISMAVNLRYRKDGAGSYTLIPDACGADNIQFFGASNSSLDIPAQSAATTEQLTSDFSTNVVGSMVRTSSAIPNLDLAQDSETEIEHLLMVCAGAAIGTTYDFRAYKQDGTALDGYTVTPRATVANSRFMQ